MSDLLQKAYEEACELSTKKHCKVSFEHDGMTYTVSPHRLGRKVAAYERRIAELESCLYDWCALYAESDRTLDEHEVYKESQQALKG